MPTTNALTLCLWKDYFDQHLTNNGGHKAFWDAERVLQQQEEEEAEREERDESMGEKGHSAALTKPSMEGRWSGPSRGNYYFSRRTREELRSIVFSRGFNYLTYCTIGLYAVVRPFYELRTMMMDGADMELKSFCFFLFDVNISAAFTIEVAMRCAASPSYFDENEPHSFFRDWGNSLDVIIIFINWLAYISVAVGFEFMFSWPVFLIHLRVFRFMKPFHGSRAFHGMAHIVDNVLQAIPMLSNVLLLTALMIIMFAVLGLYMFNGALRGRCVVNEGYTFAQTYAASMLLAEPVRFCDMSGTRNLAWPCPSTMICVDYGNPYGGYLGFDHMGFALTTVITAVSLEGWVDLMYNLKEGSGSAPSLSFFIFLVIFFSQFILALMMAALSDIFGSGARLRTMRGALDAVEGEETLSAMRTNLNPALKTEAEDIEEGVYNPFDSIVEGVRGVDWLMAKGRGVHWTEHVELLDERLARQAEMQKNYDDAYAKASEKAIDCDVYDLPVSDPLMKGLLESKAALTVVKLEVQGMTTNWDHLKWTVESWQFEYLTYMLILLSIVAQTVDACVDSGSDVSWWAMLLDKIFCGMFILEVILRIFAAPSLTAYLKDSLNGQLDIILATLCVVELISLIDGLTTAPGFRALRLLSLSRSSRLIYKLDTLRSQVVTAFLSFGTLTSLLYITIILIYVYAIVGHALFNGILSSDAKSCNFNSFGDSALTMFVVATGEDWVVPFYGIMPDAPVSSMIFFVSFYWITNWVIMQLIVAVFLENFEQDEHVKFEQQKQAWLKRITRVEKQQSVFSVAKAIPRLKKWMNQAKTASAKVAPMPEEAVEENVPVESKTDEKKHPIAEYIKEGANRGADGGANRGADGGANGQLNEEKA